MTLDLAPNHEIVLNEEDVIAVRQGGTVEIWGSDGEYLFGTIAGNSTIEDVRTAIKFYFAGYQEGKEDGRIEIQTQFRQLIGFNQ